MLERQFLSLGEGERAREIWNKEWWCHGWKLIWYTSPSHPPICYLTFNDDIVTPHHLHLLLSTHTHTYLNIHVHKTSLTSTHTQSLSLHPHRKIPNKILHFLYVSLTLFSYLHTLHTTNCIWFKSFVFLSLSL